MPKIKKGDRLKLKTNAKGFYKGQFVEVINVHPSKKSITARMPDGSVQTLLLTMVIQTLGPPILELIAEQIRRFTNWLKKK